MSLMQEELIGAGRLWLRYIIHKVQQKDARHLLTPDSASAAAATDAGGCAGDSVTYYGKPSVEKSSPIWKPYVFYAFKIMHHAK